MPRTETTAYFGGKGDEQYRSSTCRSIIKQQQLDFYCQCHEITYPPV